MSVAIITKRFVWVALAAALLVGGCRSEGSAWSGDQNQQTDLNGRRGDTPERYSGDLTGFYDVPDPLPSSDPGDLIRVMDMGTVDGRATVRVMYHSIDSAGNDRAVTGIITYPTAPAPTGGWPVISTAHGTTGIAAPCAPSRSATSAPGWGVEGVWAMTDYIGLGPLGELHPYLSKSDEGHAVIDIVRAAQNLPDSGAGSRWVSIGHSQGGHGAMAAHELASDYAPELDLVATVALSPAAMFDRVYGGIDPIVTSVLMMMSLVGGRDVFPASDPSRYLTADALAAWPVFETGCLSEITAELVPLAAVGPFTADPRQTDPARSIILAQDVGEIAVRDVAVLTASGTADDRVVIDRFDDFAARLCDSGQVAEIHVIEGATHDSILTAMNQRVTAFINGQLQSDAPVNSCATPESRSAALTPTPAVTASPTS